MRPTTVTNADHGHGAGSQPVVDGPTDIPLLAFQPAVVVHFVMQLNVLACKEPGTSMGYGYHDVALVE